MKIYNNTRNGSCPSTRMFRNVQEQEQSMIHNKDSQFSYSTPSPKEKQGKGNIKTVILLFTKSRFFKI